MEYLEIESGKSGLRDPLEILTITAADPETEAKIRVMSQFYDFKLKSKLGEEGWQLVSERILATDVTSSLSYHFPVRVLATFTREDRKSNGREQERG